jgi:hypothetical protein
MQKDSAAWLLLALLYQDQNQKILKEYILLTSIHVGSEVGTKTLTKFCNSGKNTYNTK